MVSLAYNNAEDSCSAVDKVVHEWTRMNPGCKLEVTEQRETRRGDGIPTHQLVHCLLQELTVFDVSPWGREGVNGTLQAMLDRKAKLSVQAFSEQDPGVMFLTSPADLFQDAASEAGDETLAGFVAQAVSDVNISRMFLKFLLPGAFIGSSEWHVDSSPEASKTWARCLIYQTSEHERGSCPLHYTEFRPINEPGLSVRVGFPKSLAMSGALRCESVPIGCDQIRFEHRGVPPETTECCCTLDTPNLDKFIEDYSRFTTDTDGQSVSMVVPQELLDPSEHRALILRLVRTS
eukprot:TRINITY_DN107005_c0_g1_i1.p1 TRINITY_DN107005_c0_g1~~TRINITY_DN107005_c0_g1_i1.p1  ORF type:complete len:291 (-),score=28.78 TRINITY_DN107005_c0_g1_i1:138-1010(-)